MRLPHAVQSRGRNVMFCLAPSASVILWYRMTLDRQISQKLAVKFLPKYFSAEKRPDRF
jgi:hypothetical protein